MKPTHVSSHLLLVLCAATAVMPTGHLAAQGERTRVLGFTQSNPYAQTGPETPVEALGRLLFWDPILSGEKDIACATCHHPDLAYTDGRALPLGTGAVGLGPARTDVSKGRIPVVKRNAPTVLNTAFNGLDGRRGRRGDRDLPQALVAPTLVDLTRAPMLWDRRIRSLELQALEPLKSREEMRGDAYAESAAVDNVLARLRANREYVALFGQAFQDDSAIDAQQFGQAIAAFERRLVAMNSPFDRFRAGDANALTAQQRRGLEAFEEARCDRCHQGLMFSDFDLHAEGVREHPSLAQPDPGAGRFRFRTPTLRNIALTAPYMHNGMLRTLPDVLRFYNEGRSENPNVVDRDDDDDREGRRGGNGGVASLSGGFRRVGTMSQGDIRDIIAFLESLTDTSFDKTIPARVPSGLPPGGSIRARHPGLTTNTVARREL